MDRIPKNLCEIHSLGPATREWMVSHLQSPGLAATSISFAGFTEARAGYTFVRHDPPFSAVIVTAAGEGEVLIDGRWARCPTGQAYVMPPRALNAYHIRPGRRWRLHWAIYPEAVRLPTLDAGRPPRLGPVSAPGFRLAIEGMWFENSGRADQAVVGYWATIAHRMVLRMLEAGERDSRLDRLWLAVGENIGGAWDLRRLAACAGMSQESLRRLCLRQVGRPPLSHLTRLRMNTAADILSHTEEKVASVAARVGYADAFAFSTAFKREMGLSPKRFRAVNRPAATAT
jgi:AraC-like DNA-binding protein